MPSTRLGLATAAAACLVVLAPLSFAANAASNQDPADPSSLSSTQQSGVATFAVRDTTPESRTAISKTGVDIFGVRGGYLTFAATPEQAGQLRAAGFALEPRSTVKESKATLDTQRGEVQPFDFPSEDAGYHNFAEQTAELKKVAADHPNLAALSSLGKSKQGRNLWLLKISDNVKTDEAEPEVLFTCQQHAREHLTPEMCLRIINRYTDGYGQDQAIADMVNNREIWIVTSVNPDGSEYDIARGDYAGWRKNRQAPSGTDINRNWGYEWGCCNGSSDWTGDQTYRGPSAFSTPEAKRVRDFVNSRVVDGKQQIVTHIDWHTFSELVLWPYGFTHDDTAPGLDQTQARVFQELGTQMAGTNGYTPQQSSDLYITDGTIDDWMWGVHKIWSYTFEMYPSDGGLEGFYPPDEVIERETSRNDAAVSLLLSYSDCPPRIIGGTC